MRRPFVSHGGRGAAKHNENRGEAGYFVVGVIRVRSGNSVGSGALKFDVQICRFLVHFDSVCQQLSLVL